MKSAARTTKIGSGQGIEARGSGEPRVEASLGATAAPGASSAAQSYGQGPPPAGGWKRDMPEPKVEHTHGPFAGPYSSCPACSAAQGHAATIRRVLQSLGLVRYGRFERPQAQEGLDALDALLAEHEELRARLKLACGPCAECGHIDWRGLDDILETP